MKKKIIIFSVIIIVITLWSVRYITLNATYPNPPEHTAHVGETLDMGNYCFTLNSLEWHDGNIIETILPDYTIITYSNGEAYPADKEKIALATVEISKKNEDDTYLDLTKVAFEMGAWHNQWDNELFLALNGENGLFPEMEKGETIEIIFPIVMYEFQFDKKAWREVEENYVNIVLQCYPEKYILQGSAS